MKLLLFFLYPFLLVAIGGGFGIWTIGMIEGITPKEVLRRFRLYYGAR